MATVVNDDALIRNFLGPLASDQEVYGFRESNWKRINDSNNGSYGAGNIVFRTGPLRSQVKDLHNAYVAIPIRVYNQDTGTTVAWTGVEQIAFKQSFLSLIYGIQVMLNGKTLVNDTHIEFINNLRLLTSKSVAWQLCQGQEIGFASDAAFGGATDTTRFVKTANAAGAAFDEGFRFRSSMLTGSYKYRSYEFAAPAAAGDVVNFGTGQDAGERGDTAANAGGTAAEYTLVVNLPLRYLHDIFNQYRMISLNDEWEITLLTALNPSQSQAVLQCTSATPDGDNLPAWSIRSPCELHYRHVQLDGPTNDLVSRVLADDTKFTIPFNTALYTDNLANTQTTVAQLVNSSIVNPMKLWVMMYTAGKLVSIAESECPGVCNAVGFKTSQVRLNGSNVFASDVSGVDEHWDLFKGELGMYASNQSMIDKMAYLQNYKGMMCYNLARYAKHLILPDSGNEVIFNCTKNATSVDMVYILERQAVLEVTFSSGDVRPVIR